MGMRVSGVSKPRSLKPRRPMTGADRLFILCTAAGAIFCLSQGEVLLAGLLAVVVVPFLIGDR